MSFDDFDSLDTKDSNLERLLWEARLRIKQGHFAEARERLEKARESAGDKAATIIELEGDLAFAQGRFITAERLFKEALTYNPKNTKLEEKYATSLLKIHEPELSPLRKLDDSFWSNRVPRNPVVSAIQSAVLPGLGQLHNGEWFKALILMLITIFIALAQLRSYIYALYAYRDQGVPSPGTMAIADLFRGFGIALMVGYAIIWLYAVIDAITVARYTNKNS